MTPNKFSCLLCFPPNKLTTLHHLISSVEIYACNQDSINFINQYLKILAMRNLALWGRKALDLPAKALTT
jgi:hypothetical protein